MSIQTLPLIASRSPAIPRISGHTDEFPQHDDDFLQQSAAVSAVARDEDWTINEQFVDLIANIAGALSLTSAALLGVASLWMLSL